MCKSDIENKWCAILISILLYNIILYEKCKYYLFNSNSITNEKELKRRNSDGSTTHSGKSDGPKLTYSPSFELLEWKGTTMFTIAGHRFRKLGRFTPQDKCTYCNKLMDAFLTQGHKCSGNLYIFIFMHF